MAIFGVNFNGTQIPPGIKARFADVKKLHRCARYGEHTFRTIDSTASCPDCGPESFVIPIRGEFARLVGVAQTPEERDEMLIQANNGHRKVFVIKRKTAAAPWYGIYTD